MQSVKSKKYRSVSLIMIHNLVRTCTIANRNRENRNFVYLRLVVTEKMQCTFFNRHAPLSVSSERERCEVEGRDLCTNLD